MDTESLIAALQLLRLVAVGVLGLIILAELMRQRRFVLGALPHQQAGDDPLAPPSITAESSRLQVFIPGQRSRSWQGQMIEYVNQSFQPLSNYRGTLSFLFASGSGGGTSDDDLRDLLRQRQISERLHDRASSRPTQLNRFRIIDRAVVSLATPALALVAVAVMAMIASFYRSWEALADEIAGDEAVNLLAMLAVAAVLMLVQALWLHQPLAKQSMLVAHLKRLRLLPKPSDDDDGDDDHGVTAHTSRLVVFHPRQPQRPNEPAEPTAVNPIASDEHTASPEVHADADIETAPKAKGVLNRWRGRLRRQA